MMIFCLLMLMPVRAVAGADTGRILLESEEMVSNMTNSGRHTFMSFNAEEWGTGYEKSELSAGKLNATVLTMQNGYLSVTPDLEYSLIKEPDIVYTATYMFSDDGLYACNVRTVLSDMNKEKICASLEKLLSAIADRLPQEDANGMPLKLTYSQTELNEDMKIQNVYLGEEGTFLCLQICYFRGLLIFDINTGLIEYFPSYVSEAIG